MTQSMKGANCMNINSKLFDECRKNKGYTMQSLANAMGISRSALTRKKNGESEFTVPEMEKYCNILGINKTVRQAIFFN